MRGCPEFALVSLCYNFSRHDVILQVSTLQYCCLQLLALSRSKESTPVSRRAQSGTQPLRRLVRNCLTANLSQDYVRVYQDPDSISGNKTFSCSPPDMPTADYISKHAGDYAGTTKPPVMCNPNAKPAQTCPGGKPCPKCGKPACACPKAPWETAPAPKFERPAASVEQ